MTIKSVKNKYFDSEGQPLPGVTTVLQVLDKPALVQWAWKLGTQGIPWQSLRDSRAAIGTQAHDMCEKFLLGIAFDVPTDPEGIIAFQCYRKFEQWWRKQKDTEVIGTELVMSSNYFKFGGTCDLYYRKGKKFVLIDFKTSKACYEGHKVQQSAYKILLEEEGRRVDEIKLFQINENKSGIVNIPNKLVNAYQHIFLSALEIYKARKTIDSLTKK